MADRRNRFALLRLRHLADVLRLGAVPAGDAAGSCPEQHPVGARFQHLQLDLPPAGTGVRHRDGAPGHPLGHGLRRRGGRARVLDDEPGRLLRRLHVRVRSPRRRRDRLRDHPARPDPGLQLVRPVPIEGHCSGSGRRGGGRIRCQQVLRAGDSPSRRLADRLADHRRCFGGGGGRRRAIPPRHAGEGRSASRRGPAVGRAGGGECSRPNGSGRVDRAPCPSNSAVLSTRCAVDRLRCAVGDHQRLRPPSP